MDAEQYVEDGEAQKHPQGSRSEARKLLQVGQLPQLPSRRRLPRRKRRIVQCQLSFRQLPRCQLPCCAAGKVNPGEAAEELFLKRHHQRRGQAFCP